MIYSAMLRAVAEDDCSYENAVQNGKHDGLLVLADRLDKIDPHLPARLVDYCFFASNGIGCDDGGPCIFCTAARTLTDLLR